MPCSTPFLVCRRVRLLLATYHENAAFRNTIWKALHEIDFSFSHTYFIFVWIHFQSVHGHCRKQLDLAWNRESVSVAVQRIWRGIQERQAARP
jgi:hypothetical protein